MHLVDFKQNSKIYIKEKHSCPCNKFKNQNYGIRRSLLIAQANNKEYIKTMHPPECHCLRISTCIQLTHVSSKDPRSFNILIFILLDANPNLRHDIYEKDTFQITTCCKNGPQFILLTLLHAQALLLCAREKGICKNHSSGCSAFLFED